MALKLPEVKSIGPQEPGSVGRIDANVPNFAAAQDAGMKAVGGVVDVAAKFFEKKENDQAELEGIRAQVEYGSTARGQLEQLKQYDGDPTDAYEKFRNTTKESQEKIFERYKGAPSYVQQQIREKVAKQDAEIQAHASTNETLQRSAFQDKTNDAGVKLDQQSMMDFSSQLQLDDKGELTIESLAKFQSPINEMTNKRLALMRDRGLVIPVENEDGTTGEKLTDMAKIKIKQDRSAGLMDVVRTLQNSGKVDVADKLMEHYGDDILNSDKQKLTSNGKGARDRSDAQRGAYDVRDMKPDEAMAELDKRFGSDPVKLDLAEKAYVASQKRREYATKTVVESARNDLAEYIRDTKGKFVTAAEVENDPYAKQMIQQMKDKGGGDKVAKILQSVEQPPVSTPEAKSLVWSNLLNHAYTKENYGQFQEDLAGTSKADRTKMENAYISQVNQTDPQRQSMFVSLGKEVQARLTKANVLKYEYGRLTDASKQKLGEVIADMHDASMTMDPKTNQEAFVKQFVASQVEGKAFTATSTTVTKLITRATPPPTAPTPGQVKDAAKVVTGPEERKAMRDWFKTANGRDFNSGAPHFDSIIKVKADFQKRKK